MKLCIDTYLSPDRPYRVVDLGSRISDGQEETHRDLLDGYDCKITGVDIRDGRNVDVVMRKPYRLPLKSNSADVIISGQTFEHIPFFWATMLEMARVLAPGGVIFLTAPSRGHEHNVHDCWRYYPDGMRALAAFSRLKLVEAHTDMPPTLGGGRRHDYAQIDRQDRYWGDTVGVFRKPQKYSKRINVTRAALVWWANRVGGIDDIPLPKSRPARRKMVVNELHETEPEKAARLGYIVHGEFECKIAYDADVISDRITKRIALGGYERSEGRRASSLVEDGDRVIELGAGLGFLSTVLLNSKRLGDYQMVEADPRLVDMIRRTHELNDVEGPVTMNSCVATCNKEMLDAGSVDFFVGKKFCASSLLGANNLLHVVKVPVVSLPDMIRDHRSNVLILDIEGGETDIINGTALDGINKILIEIHPARLGQSGVRDLFRNLDTMGFVYDGSHSAGDVCAFRRVSDERPRTEAGYTSGTLPA